MPRSPLSIDGYQYKLNRVYNNLRYYMCTKCALPCFARGVLKPDGNFSLSVSHNHPQDFAENQLFYFRRELRQSVGRSTSSCKDIYESIRLLYPEAANLLPFTAVESAMFRWRRTCRPPYPNTLQEYYDLLISEKWCNRLTYDRGALQCYFLKPSENVEILLFYNPTYVEPLLSNCEMNVDATFKCVPCNVGLSTRSAQCFTIMVTIHNHSIPCIWALMSKRTAEAYVTLFQHLKSNFPSMTATQIMCDYERALYQSLMEIFPESEIHGCFFHFCQAIYRQSKKLGLGSLMTQNEHAQFVLRKIMALALLPCDMAVEGFNLIKSEAPDDIRNAFSNFFTYVESTWLEGVTPQLFSVFNLVRRTNNAVEAYHRVLNQKFGVHPNVWAFTEHLVQLQSKSHNDVIILHSGQRVTRLPKVRYLLNAANISRAWRELQNQQISLSEFLENAKYFVSSLVRTLLSNDNSRHNDDLNDVLLIDGARIVETRIENAIVDTMRTANVNNASESNSRDDNLHTNRPTTRLRTATIANNESETISLSNTNRSRRTHPSRPLTRRVSQRRTRRRTSVSTLVSNNGNADTSTFAQTTVQASVTRVTPEEDAEIMEFVDRVLHENSVQVTELHTENTELLDNFIADLPQGSALTLELDRSSVVKDMFSFYSDPMVTLKSLNIVFKGELGSDFGGLTKEAFTIFWNEVVIDYFRGEDVIIPFLPLHRIRRDKMNFKLIGRILTHMFILTKNLPTKLPLCVYLLLLNNEEISDEIIMNDFKLFVTKAESTLISKAISSFSQLSTVELYRLQEFYSSYGMYDIPREDQIQEQILTLATDILISKPKDFITIMRSGILDTHLTTVWNVMTVDELSTILNQLKPSPQKVVDCIVQREQELTNDQSRVFYYLQQFVLSLSDSDLQKFLLFVTGSIHLPSSILVTFNNLNGLNRRPIAHTCSNLIEISSSYSYYQEFTREMKQYLAHDFSYEYSQI
uniref:HECT domain-containing protein n=1 Tax=Photinus pyralis TaxID=7054 RepID=A0A1Y1M514_PHOPY